MHFVVFKTVDESFNFFPFRICQSEQNAIPQSAAFSSLHILNAAINITGVSRDIILTKAFRSLSYLSVIYHFQTCRPETPVCVVYLWFCKCRNIVTMFLARCA